jgi:DoxX-like family
MKRKAISYWVITAFLVFNIFTGGIAELFRLKGNVDGMIFLGYPIYFLTILGTWKLLGTIELLVPRFPRLKEWAYAGIFFNMAGAAISHAVRGDAAWHVYYTGFLAILTIASWALRPQSRTLGIIFPAKTYASSTNALLQGQVPQP